MCVILTGYFSKNKYAMLAAVRTGIGMLNLELFFRVDDFKCHINE